MCSKAASSRWRILTEPLIHAAGGRVGPLGGYGTSVTAFKRDINTLMLDLDPGGYQLTEIDLSVFGKLHD